MITLAGTGTTAGAPALPVLSPTATLMPITVSNVAPTALTTLLAAPLPASLPGALRLPLTAVGAPACTGLEVWGQRTDLHDEPEWREPRPSTTYGAWARGIFERVQAALERHFRVRVRGAYEDILLVPASADRPAIQRLVDALELIWAHAGWEDIDQVQISTQQVLCRAADFFPALDVQLLRAAVTTRLNHAYDGRHYDHVVINPDNGHVTAYAGGAFHSLLSGRQDASRWSPDDMGMWSYAQRTGMPSSWQVTAVEALSEFPLLRTLHAGRFPLHVAAC